MLMPRSMEEVGDLDPTSSDYESIRMVGIVGDEEDDDGQGRLVQQQIN